MKQANHVGLITIMDIQTAFLSGNLEKRYHKQYFGLPGRIILK
jgi:hypothetical protein